MCQRPPAWHALALAAAAALAGCPSPPAAPSGPSGLVVDRDARVAAEAHGAEPAARLLAGWLGAGREGPGRTVALALADGVPAGGFHLDVGPSGARIVASDEAGLFYGAEELAIRAGSRPIGAAPSAPLPLFVPAGAATWAPRASYRGMHLDVARHFFSKEAVLRYVDLLAFYKFNVFHWHLTDDQGFRLEIRGHPELTAEGGKDGHYTQDEAREIVRYAAARGITVIPEIDMPGHTRAILASHPELSCTGERMPVPRTWGVFDDVLCAGNDATFELVEDVLREVAALFPSKLVHVGGDEVPHRRWDECPKCAARMRALGVDAAGLQGWFHARVAEILRRLGKRPMLWDEAVAAGAPADAVIVAWRGVDRGLEAARAGHDVVFAPHDVLYFNTKEARDGSGPGHEGLITYGDVLGFELPRGPHVLGAEGALWTEHVETPAEIDELVLPRMQALSLALSGEASSARASARFALERASLDRSSVRYHVEPPTGLRDKKVFLDRASLVLAPPPPFLDGVVRYTLDGSEPTARAPAYERPIAIAETTTVRARLFLPGGRESAALTGVFAKEVPRPPRPAPVDRVKYTYYEGAFQRLPNFDRLTPAHAGTLDRVRLDPSFRAEHFAVRYEGGIAVDATAVYRVVARADDGVRVLVDGELVVEDDGEHAPRDRDGEIALAAGTHELRVEYFQGEEGKELSIRIARAP